jgi:ABC-type glycerol-3-phosphate transport system substrate-binding protein
MHQLSTFQIIVLGIFSVLILLGVGVFAAFGGLGSGNAVGPVTIWGTVDGGVMQQMINTMRQSDRTFVEKSPINYEAELINAMAAGQGPDLLLLEQSSLQVFSDKIITIPYSEISQGTFINSYIDEGQLFLTSQGILALPFSIDPLVMYWNRDLFSSAGFAGAPQYWNDFLTFAPKVSSLSGLTPIKKSAVALGQWENIPNAKEILSTLFLQSGDRIVVRLPAQAGGTEGALQVVLGTRPEGATTDPASSALRFYTEFANPNKTTYSWNRSLPSSPQMFAAGDLAVYFGFASEYASFGMRNPNLRYAVAPMPQIEGSSSQVVMRRARLRWQSNLPTEVE